VTGPSVEAALADLARQIAWPGEVNVAIPGPRRQQRRLAWAAVLAGVALLLALTPPGRQAVAGLARVVGIEIEFRELDVTVGDDLSLGRAVDLTGAAAAVDFELQVPRQLGLPDALYVRSGGAPIPQVWMVWAASDVVPEVDDTGVGALLTQFRAVPEVESLTKLAGAGVDVVQVDVGGEPGFWLAGGPHVVVFDRGTFAESSRMAANVLIWTNDGITYRLESSLDLQAALALATDLGPAT